MSGRAITECACGKIGRFKTPNLCAACKKEENRVYNPEKQKEYFDRWYANQKVNGYPSFDWAKRNAKKERQPESVSSSEGTEAGN
jgi:hypothetical protein